jgi:hypothetical protein
MDKFSQTKRQTGRGILNQFREAVNIPGSYLEKVFTPELDRVMVSLKELDDKIRSELTGTQIGNAEAPEIDKSAKELLKSARNNFNRREYMSGISDLGLFHKKMYDVTVEIDKFYVDINKIHHKFLFEGLDDKQKKKFDKFRQHMERKSELSSSEYFIKEAGIMDFYYNFLTTRGLGLRAWEKKYPKQTKALREGGARLISSAESMLSNVISSFKQMATARAIRRPDDYMDAANKIKIEFNKFDSGDKGFKAYYTNVVVPFIKIKDEVEAGQQVPTTTPTPTSAPPADKTELGATPKPPAVPPVVAPTPALGGNPPGASAPFAPGAPEETAPITKRDPIPAGSVAPPETAPADTKLSYNKFIKSLEALGEEDPRILANYISKYAASIQGADPETAISLFSLARQIKG